ncbi:hypothetical protein J4D97_14280, partial [Hymenobacter defluvii]|nr:hypothetical protein [Hymenobacter defluvii]
MSLAVSCSLLLACGQSSAQKDRRENVLVITKGGVYSGSYRSLDSSVPCVRIATTEPVQLVNCTL